MARNDPEGPPDPAAGPAQIRRYADDIARLFKIEKERRRELQRTNAQLKRYAEDLGDTIRELKAANRRITQERNYNERILESSTDAILATDNGLTIRKINARFQALMGEPEGVSPVGRSIDQVFAGPNLWVASAAHKALVHGGVEQAMDTELWLPQGRRATVNLTVAPLQGHRRERNGLLLAIEDISFEQRLRSTLARYMTKSVADRLIQSDEGTLGGALQPATVLFADIRDFTGMAERLSAREVVDLLNEYFSEMVEVVFGNDGFLDKYIGDAIMAVFGVPFPDEGDAENAVATGVGMLRALAALNARRTRAGRAEIQMGVGINSGEVLVGNVGTTKRMDFTVIGDAVNVAARVETLTRTYNTPFLISDATLARLKPGHLVREIDLVKVRGRATPVRVYEVLDHWPLEDRDRLAEALGLFRQGLAHVRAAAWRDALAQFQAVLAIVPGDGPASVYAERCRRAIGQGA